jgi:hypothetical protein
MEIQMAQDDVVDDVVDVGDFVEEYFDDNSGVDDDDDVILKCFLIVDGLQYDSSPSRIARD